MTDSAITAAATNNSMRETGEEEDDGRICCNDDDGHNKKSLAQIPVDLLESCRNVQPEQQDKEEEEDSTALTVDSLRLAGVELVTDDIRLIDDTDELVDDSVLTEFVEKVKGTVAMVEVAERFQNGAGETKEEEVEEKKLQEDSSCPGPKSPLKSALKKGSGRQNKGLKVSFHDTHVFFIDTEAEVSAEPQLLTVRTFDLPLALSDIRVFTPTFDFIPSLPPGSYGAAADRHYTYEDAIVSFDDCDDILVCRNVAQPPPPGNNNHQQQDVVDIPSDVLGTSSVEVLDVAAAATPTTTDCPLLTALQQESESHAAEDATTKSVQSLTEANLKQHEIIMANDVLRTKSEPPFATTVPSPRTVCSGTSSDARTLSPPLKELSVDVRPDGGGNTDDWQVELSPLNSIPESETESSNSSQDTIIMMTTEESRRNEEHIQLSTEAFQKTKHQEGEEQEQEDAASQCSQDSDETLKQVEVVTTIKKPVDGQQQRTSDQIRQLLERNAVRRNHLRYSNVRKKQQQQVVVDGGGVPVERQRQWRSHESLLDTIKKLTLDEADYSTHNGHHEAVNGLHSESLTQLPHQEEPKSPSQTLSTSGRISNDLGRLIAAPRGVLAHMRSRQQQQQQSDVTKAEVPGDVRQWKIRSSLWNSLGATTTNGTTNGFCRSSQPLQANGHCSAASSLDITTTTTGGDLEDVTDELLLFVNQDSERIERIRKRYSYTDGDDYESIGSSFARRPSVRGIKPRFGSTTEILKQLQNQLQPPPLTCSAGSHLTWPYPRESSTAHQSNNFGNSTLQTSRHPNSLPVVEEEIYGTSKSPISATKMASYGNHNEYQPVYRTKRGRDASSSNYASVVHQGPPPPYQPPPPPYNHHLHQQPPVRVIQQFKDERGVPEGASSTPKVLYDSLYHQAPSPGTFQNHHQTPSNASGCVYYVMQV